MAGDGFNLTVGAARFLEVSGCILTQAMKGVFVFVTVQPKALQLTLPVFLKSVLAKWLTSRGAGETVGPKQFRRDNCIASTFGDSQFSL